MTARKTTAQILLGLLRAVDQTARLDQNDATGAVYEVRMYGSHVGFVRIDSDGRLAEWI